MNLLVVNCGFYALPEFVAVREQQKQYQVWGEKNVIWKQDFLLDGSVVQRLALLPHSKKLLLCGVLPVPPLVFSEDSSFPLTVHRHQR